MNFIRLVDGTLTSAIGGRVQFPSINPYDTRLQTLITSLLHTNVTSRPDIVNVQKQLERYASSLTFEPVNV